MIEILAPAGSMESLIAAVRCGANAVYLGTKNLNARRSASNFDNEQLKQAVKYCHSHNVLVYLTANILVSDSEMRNAYDTIKSAVECGVDGFIVQDLGLAKLIRKHFPDARLHASTQCSVNTPEGVKQLQKLGFSRVVIPREMSMDEIKEIRNSTDIELELFVHGALCMCVSGQCYLSAMIGGRSGNRGLCAQPCRLAFSADNSGSCDLSLKDLSLISKVKEIEKAGVISLKIEGRMKRPEYVAAAVTACKKAIDGNYDSKDEKILKSVFSRSGFTDGYFTGKRQNMFGTRQKEDVVSAKDVLKDLSHLYDNENPLIPVDFHLVFKENQPITLRAKTEKKTVTLSTETPEKAINRPLSKEDLEKRISKLGGTQYCMQKFTADVDDGLIISAGILNKLRRDIVELLNTEEKKNPTILEYKETENIKKNSIPYFTARFSDAAQIPEKHNFKRIFLPISSRDDDFIKHNAGVEIPRGLFGMENRLIKDLLHLKEIGVTKALCGNLGAYQTAQKLGFEVFGDFGLNIFNSKSAQLFNAPILSFELTLEQANKINQHETGIVGYGKLPLMITRNCPVKNRIGCEKCQKQGTLTDRKGYTFQVKCSNYPCVEVLNPVPIYLGDRMHEIKTDFIHFYFTDESKEKINNLLNMYKNNERFTDKYTRGLYYRGVI